MNYENIAVFLKINVGLDDKLWIDFAWPNLSLKPSKPLLSVLKTDQEVFYPLEVTFFKILPYMYSFLHLFLPLLLSSHIYSPQEVHVNISTKNLVYFKCIPTLVCVALKFLLSKAIVKYRARAFLPDTIYSRSHKSNSTAVVKKFSCCISRCCAKH